MSADKPHPSYVYVSAYALSFPLDEQEGVRIQSYPVFIILYNLRDIPSSPWRLTTYKLFLRMKQTNDKDATPFTTVATVKHVPSTSMPALSPYAISILLLLFRKVT
jgi:hypothetical protein